ncbi:MAG TPA: ATP-binding protein [Thermoanaerobaculia bacterium]|nr:ATP-binding protein [Thermoanaerobaculia bacterium]
MTLDVRTLLALFALTQALQVVVLSVQYALFRSYRGTGAFLLWSAAVGAGSVAFLFRDHETLGRVAIFAQNGLIVFGTLCLWAGLCRFHGRDEDRRLFGAVLVPYLAAHAFLLWVVPDIDLRAVALCAALVVSALLSARELWRERTGESRPVALVLVAGLLAHAAFFAYRGAVLLIGAHVGDVWGSAAFNVAPYVDGFLLTNLVTFGIVILVNRRVNAEVREARDHFRRLLDTIPDAVLMTRVSDGICRDANEGFEALTGYRRDEIVGRSSTELGVWVDPRARDRVFERALESDATRDLELEGRRRDGTPFVGSVSARRVDVRGEPHVLSVVHDVTGRYAAREALQRSDREIRELNAGLERRVAERTAELTAKNAELEAFVHSIAHDLRAPLRAIEGFSGILEEEHSARLDDEGRRLLARVRGGARRMDRLLRDLVEYARAGSAGLRHERVDLGVLARGAFEDVVPAEAREAWRFVVGDLPTARGDAALLRVVLRHLLANAVKYAAAGPGRSVEVRGRVEAGHVVCEVVDDGVGFDPAHAGRLFRVFERLHAGEGDDGTGIGLAIVRRIVERHGGSVHAEGRPGQGATFAFSLPETGESDA